MSIKYKKGPIKYRKIVSPKKLKSKKYSTEQNPSKSIFSTLLIIIGVFTIVSQISPTIKFFIDKNFTNKYNEFLSPVPNHNQASSNDTNQIGKFEYQYFSDLFDTLNNRKGSIAGARVPYKHDWSGFFSMSIPSVGIKNIRITANVDSYNESVYNNVLRNSLAHFKGTDLPADNDDYNLDTNTYIYGHSAASSWARLNKTSYEAVFNPLFDINVGDKIYVKFEDKEFSYTVYKTKITKPEDMTTLQGISGKKTLTLMTCAPPGSSLNRLNVVAILD